MMGMDAAPICLEELDGLARINDPVTIGVPLPRGYLRNAAEICLSNQEGKIIGVQARPLSWWPDGSIQWLLVDFFASLGPREQVRFNVRRDEGGLNPLAPGIRIQEEPECITVDTGVAQFVIPRGGAGLLGSVRMGNDALLGPEGVRLRFLDQKGRLANVGRKLTQIEDAGPLRSSVRITGELLPRCQTKGLEFSALLTFFSGCSTVHLSVKLHNPNAARHKGGLWDLGDPGSAYFRAFSIEGFTAEVPESITYATASQSQPVCRKAPAPWSLYQDSSGGENWHSSNHVDFSGERSVSFQGYRVFSDGRQVESGSRATPFVQLNTAGGWIAGSVCDFWQNFPKALRAEGRRLDISLFPEETKGLHELQAGEQKRHDVYLDFGLPGTDSRIPSSQLPLHAYTPAEWTQATGALSGFVPQAADGNETYKAYVAGIIEGPSSFLRKREIVDEYGWRHFGDLYADHEAVNHTGVEPLISHYNNQYDFIYGAFLHFMRSGDRRWRALMADAARHVIDIDIYHTDRDKAAYSHGLFWHTDHYRDAGTGTHRGYTKQSLKHGASKNYGGGPSNEQDYSSGLLYYHFLTGDSEARNAVLELARWVMHMDDGRQTIFGLVDDGPTGLASQTAFTDYHGPGRGAGNSINTLMDAYRLTGNRVYLEKAEALIRRCVHPEDNISALALDDPERRWSYLVFLQILGKYLDLKMALEERDYHFFHARDSLLHYADWMMENEVPYKEVLHKVDIPTETWPAQDIRKSCVLNFAGKYAPDTMAEAYFQKARFFFDRCLEDLLSFETACLTRPLVLLSVYGAQQSYFDVRTAPKNVFLEHNHCFGEPAPFIPQKARIRKSLVEKIGVAKKELFRMAMEKINSSFIR